MCMILQFTSRNIATKKNCGSIIVIFAYNFEVCVFSKEKMIHILMCLKWSTVIEINFYYLLPKVQTKVQSWTRCWQRQLYCSQTMLLFLVFLLIRNLIPCKYFYLFSKLVPRVYRKIEGRTTERIWKFFLFFILFVILVIDICFS